LGNDRGKIERYKAFYYEKKGILMGGIPTGYNLSNAEAKAEKIQFEMIFQS